MGSHNAVFVHYYTWCTDAFPSHSHFNVMTKYSLELRGSVKRKKIKKDRKGGE